MSGAAVLRLPVRRVRACGRFEINYTFSRFCKDCGFTELLHPKFYCGACGEKLRDGDDNSECTDHGGGK